MRLCSAKSSPCSSHDGRRCAALQRFVGVATVPLRVLGGGLRCGVGGGSRAVEARSGEEPDWTEEMSIFTKRISRPNQLATLRELTSKMRVGKVLFVKDSLAIISGLDSDAPVGTKLSFVTGGTGILLWHRSNNLAFAIVLGGASLINAGTMVECKIAGVLQVVDEVMGPSTKKEYQMVMGPSTKKEYQMVTAPAGDELFGRAVNFFGVPLQLPGDPVPSPPSPARAAPGGDCDSASPSAAGTTGFSKTRPLLNSQADMASREQITECLLTGVKGLDILTPLGRGMNLLVIGPRGSGRTSLGLDAALAQAGSGVRVVYASVSQTPEQLAAAVGALRAGKAMANTAVVASPHGAAVGEQLATIHAACSIGERIRDEGGHALVVLDTVKPLIDAWEIFIEGLSGLGKNAVLEGLLRDNDGNEITIPSDEEDEKLVDYQGMLVSGAIAQRRGFLSTLFMRPAKLHQRLGGGSMTLLPLVPGRCATGVKKKVDMSKYETLSEEQKTKIAAVLEAKARAEASFDASVDVGEIATEVVEEFISISDGQVVLGPRSDCGSYVVNPRLSITRVGTRAYHKAMEELAAAVRLDLAQADDARKFSLSPDDRLIMRADAYSRRIQAALLQEMRRPASLEQQVVTLLAIQRGFTDDVAPELTGEYLTGALRCVWAAAFESLQELGMTKILTAAAEKKVLDALRDHNRMWREGRGQ
ncbi:hypothetical protein FOA52_011873 [Chlamydomonas sp. UWO 241]|nr:hypothetical protein FOA52_011873 [Chlamydomonas sp. UWO 241]